MGKRMELWRLGNFELERLPSSEGIYLFRGVARENPGDERLFAFAEVRDLTPLYDDNGRISRLPHLEMMVMETLAAIRLFQSHRSARARLQWNRVFLYVWPVIEFGAQELNTAAQLLVPVGARDLAMGGANLANTENLEAIYWNPAGLSSMANRAAGQFSTMQIFNDIRVNYVAVAVKASEFVYTFE